MHASKIFSLLALAAAVVALPAPQDQDVVIVTEVVTKFVTAGQPAAAVPTTAIVQDNGDGNKQKHNHQAPASPTAEVAQPTATSTGSSGDSNTSTDTSNGYMGVVNSWRKKLGLSDLNPSTKLEGNCGKTTNDGGSSMVHELNPGTSAQVLAPGSATDLKSFEHAFVGGWLCERPNLPGLGSGCSDFGSGWAQNGETGHADILTSPDYSNIGCAANNGILCCDLS